MSTKVLESVIDNNFITALYIHERKKFMNEYNKDLEVDKIYNMWLKRTLLDNQPKSAKLKLNIAGLTKEQFVQMLEGSETVNDNHISYIEKSQWYRIFNEGCKLIEKYDLNQSEKVDITIAFKPFVTYAYENLSMYIKQKKLDKHVNTQTFLISLINSLSTTLTQIALRSIVLELHIAKLKEELSGETPEERFQYFIKNTFNNINNLKSFYAEYSVLTRLLSLKTNFFVVNTKKFIDRYSQDFDEMESYFHLYNEKISTITTDLGDTHQQGNTVVKINYESGKQLIYKPKTLIATERFHKFVDWINNKNEIIPLKYHKVLNKNTHGWEELIENKPCKSKDELKDYYKRFGAIICVIHLLRGCDLHLENIIASGNSPYIIDLETIFHQYIPFDLPKNAELIAKDNLTSSVLGTALLPMSMFRNVKGKGIDMSALNGKEQDLPFKVLQLQSMNTDNMIFKHDYGKSISSNNIPTLEGSNVIAGDFIEEIKSGFKDAYLFFLKNKKDLLSEDSPIKLFEDIEIRIIARSTQSYANFLQESTHPDYTRNAVEREVLFDRLWFYPFKTKEIIQSEINDMIEGDIPFFTTTTISKDLINSRGEKIEGVFENSTYDLVIERLRKISIETMNEQLELISLSTAGLNQKDKVKYSETRRADILSSSTVDQSIDFVSEAKKIASYLEKRAFTDSEGKSVTWISKQIAEDGTPFVFPLDSNLYSGLSGISLFFLYVGKLTKEEKYYDLSKACLQTVVDSPSSNKSSWEVSAYYGLGSLLLPLYLFNKVTESFFFESEFNNYVNLIEEYIEKDQALDHLSGCSGLIHVFLNFYIDTKEERYLELAKKCANHIIKNSIEKEKYFICNSQLSPVPLGGFAHGSSGIAWSLLRISKYDNKYLKYGKGILEFDRSLFEEEINGWKDNRKDKIEDSNQWCHGSTGIGLSRILISSYYVDKHLNEEINISLEKMLDGYVKNDHGLCHGNMGDLELLLNFSINSGNKTYYQHAVNLAQDLINKIELQNDKKFTHDLSLFNGLAGIGYQLLRLQYPNVVPSVLTLEKI
ncbi:type 2 lanthipeptide synthetase LanM family protein [Priestia megaterium]|uniref:type 2 lanthipeptide synthetase LanM family protein n=1 Tax=Priestia megaterium TaxID=1404 RepID=UPI0036DF787B